MCSFYCTHSDFVANESDRSQSSTRGAAGEPAVAFGGVSRVCDREAALEHSDDDHPHSPYGRHDWCHHAKRDARVLPTFLTSGLAQLEAPEAERGRIIGAYTMFGPGMMTFSGVTTGALGSLLTVPHAVLVSGIVLAVGAFVVGLWRWFTRG